MEIEDVINSVAVSISNVGMRRVNALKKQSDLEIQMTRKQRKKEEEGLIENGDVGERESKTLGLTRSSLINN